jgi:hypothetical protein
MFFDKTMVNRYYKGQIDDIQENFYKVKVVFIDNPIFIDNSIYNLKVGDEIIFCARNNDFTNCFIDKKIS